MTNNSQQTEAAIRCEKKRKLDRDDKAFFKRLIYNIQWRGLNDLADTLRIWARKFNLEELEVLKFTLPLWARRRGYGTQAEVFSFLQEEEIRAAGE